MLNIDLEIDRQWLLDAWGQLVEAGLASYRDDLERHLVIIRLITLAWMYHHFKLKVHFGFEEAWMWSNVDFFEMRNNFGISAFRMGQLAQPDRHLDRIFTYDTNDDELVDSMMPIIVQQQRPFLFNALVDAYGSVAELFDSLWQVYGSISDDGIYYANKNEWPPEHWSHFTDMWSIEERIVDGLEMEVFYDKREKVRGFEWVANGMKP